MAVGEASCPRCWARPVSPPALSGHSGDLSPHVCITPTLQPRSGQDLLRLVVRSCATHTHTYASGAPSRVGVTHHSIAASHAAALATGELQRARRCLAHRAYRSRQRAEECRARIRPSLRAGSGAFVDMSGLRSPSTRASAGVGQTSAVCTGELPAAPVGKHDVYLFVRALG